MMRMAAIPGPHAEIGCRRLQYAAATRAHARARRDRRDAFRGDFPFEPSRPAGLFTCGWMSADLQQMNSKAIDPVAQVDPALVHELAQEMVQALNLDVTAEQIDPKAPLYGDGLGLDSIDILEVALVVSRKYGFQLRANDEGNVRIFSSLESLARHVASHRTK